VAKLHFVGFAVAIVVDIDDHTVDHSRAFETDHVGCIGLIGRNIGDSSAIVNDFDNVAV
jgi:hypothetical protein